MKFPVPNAERENVIKGLFCFRKCRRFCKCDCFLNFLLKTSQQLLFPLVCPKFALIEIRFHAWNRISTFPLMYLCRIAILCRIDLRVPVPAVSLALQQRLALPLASTQDT